MAGCIYEDRVDAEHEDDGTLVLQVQQPVRETNPPYISVEGSMALSVKGARDLQRRLGFAISAAEGYTATRSAAA
jgi:hypothetical protein